MRYISLFSGIEAATVAWEPLGWEPVVFCEIDKFPSAVLAHRFPYVPNLGDITKVDWEEVTEHYGAVDLIVGGSPCQSFSIAGGRESLDGESALCFEYWRAVRDVRPTWFLWENVPGVFSTRDNAFGQFLGKMEELGYGMAWRTLDAQFFGVAQRRRRVFLVGYLGNVGRAAAVLFDSESVRGNIKPSRQKREELARAAGIGAASGGFKFHQGAGAGGIGYSAEQSPTLTADWHNPAVLSLQTDHLSQNGTNVSVEISKTLDVASAVPVVVTQYGDVAGSLTARADSSPCADRGQNIVCIADDNTNASINVETCGSLKVGGCSMNSAGKDYVNALCARDYKGIGNQDIGDGKLICQCTCSNCGTREPRT